jgi:hypothetical protein
MKKSALVLAVALATLLTPLGANANTPPNAEKMKMVLSFVGDWNCTWHAGPNSGTLLSTFTPVMGGSWVQETETVKAPDGSSMVQTMHFTGYDPTSKMYMHMGPNEDGTYEVARSSDFHLFYNIHPEGMTAAATFTRVSDSEFTLSEPFTQGGQKMVYAEKCIKAS